MISTAFQSEVFLKKKTGTNIFTSCRFVWAYLKIRSLRLSGSCCLRRTLERLTLLLVWCRGEDCFWSGRRLRRKLDSELFGLSLFGSNGDNEPGCCSLKKWVALDRICILLLFLALDMLGLIKQIDQLTSKAFVQERHVERTAFKVRISRSFLINFRLCCKYFYVFLTTLEFLIHCFWQKKV